MLEPGDRAPQFLLKDQQGHAKSPVENRVAGKPLVLLFTGGSGSTFAEFAKQADAFADADATLFVIGHGNRGTPDDALQNLTDRDGATHAKYGCNEPSVCILDLDARILDIFPASGSQADVDRALRGVDAALKVAPDGTLSMHAPVLVIPRVLDPAGCQRVIEAWEHLDREPIEARGARRNEASHAFFDAYGNVRQHVPRDPALLAYLDERLPRRLGLEIRKAFQTGISRREDYRIACYEGALGGSLGPHRDNMTEATKHRRFTASIQLNTDDYTGGELRFPEYGRQLYRGAPGTAVVFSASLLHEVLPVTEGRRFMLGTHLFGD